VNDPGDQTVPFDRSLPTVRMDGEVPTPATAPGGKADTPIPTIPEVTIDQELGRGGMGVVYRGRQTYLGRAVAIKVLKTGIGGDEYIVRFRREATILAGLSHPHIVACHQAGTTPDGACYLVMEFIDGPNLWHHVRAQGPLAPAVVVRIIRDIAAALSYAQGKGIIHRDVKGENILLAREAGNDQPFVAKLVDLGLAKPTEALGDAALTRQGVLLGTPSTMAPEQFDDPEHVDHRADMYGLGCAAFQALTGEPAFRGSSLMDLVSAKASGVIPDPMLARRDCPLVVAGLIRRLLARRPEDRFATYSELIATCDEILAEKSASSAPRGSLVVKALIGIVVIGIGVIALVNGLSKHESPPTESASGSTAATSPAEPLPPVDTPTASTVDTGAAAVPRDVVPSPVPVRVETWSAAVPLVSDDPIHGLDGWVVDPGWGLSEQESGLVGSSAGHIAIRRHMPNAPWRLEGTFGPAGKADYHAAAIRVTDNTATSVLIAVRNLGPTRYLAIERQRENALVERLHFAALTAPAPWDFVCTAVGQVLTVNLAGTEVTIEVASEPTELALEVDKGAVAFPELRWSRPAN
jgi:serine/threonine protein kinase